MIEQYSKDGELINIYYSISIASYFLKKGRPGESAICNCCKGKRNSAYGYVWKYAK